MSLGDSLLGEGLLGEDDVALAVAEGLMAPRAVKFDPKTRDFPLDENGRYEDLHPVDAAVRGALFLEFGKIASAPSTGQTFKQIGSPIGIRVRTNVEMRVHLALKRLTDRKAISIKAIRHEAKSRHTLFVEVDYVNLITQREGSFGENVSS